MDSDLRRMRERRGEAGRNAGRRLPLRFFNEPLERIGKPEFFGG